MKIDILTKRFEQDYKRFLENAEAGLTYYTLEFRNFLVDLLGAKARYLIAHENGQVKGIMPALESAPDEDGGTIINALPFFGSHGAPIGEPEAVAALVGEFSSMLAEDQVLSGTLIGNPFQHDAFVGDWYTHTDTRISQVTMLPKMRARSEAISACLALIDGSARRNVRKASGGGVRVRVDNDAWLSLKKFHLEGMKEIGGQAKSADFFELLPKHLAEGKNYNIYVAEMDGEVISCLLLLYFGNTVEYFVPATSIDARSNQPLAAILVEAMTDAVLSGYLHWNWGGTWPTQQGVYRFKKKWGATERTYNYYNCVKKPAILKWSPQEVGKRFPNFYAFPF